MGSVLPSRGNTTTATSPTRVSNTFVRALLFPPKLFLLPTSRPTSDRRDVIAKKTSSPTVADLPSGAEPPEVLDAVAVFKQNRYTEQRSRRVISCESLFKALFH